ncbi:TKL protein kinase, variant 2 [Capsaspora owczarzaki ATCC 30864]|nr:TKL protein kinase, variant 1 [Capsaspora owczarzaki ATCC 30864]KJE95990.1 TKL protein kinase, variant 2 [Capsaspora owczarzaki ATCC 30864]
MLTYLELARNELTSIDASTFSGLTRMTDLALHNNRITNLAVNTFVGMSQLTSLTLQFNRITSISANTFNGLVALSYLFLSDNQITSIAAGAFTGDTSLQQLALHNNQLTSIPASQFSGLIQLQYLTLSNSSFTTLPPGLFQGLPNGLFLGYKATNPFYTLVLSPNNFTFDGNAVAPPSTYGSASNPNKCDTACATCYAGGPGACCGTNCLICDSTGSCTRCYDGYGMLGGSCLPLASVASASVTSVASAASIASAATSASASFASAATSASASFASLASVASSASASFASLASDASFASAASASSAAASASSAAASAASTASASLASAASASSAWQTSAASVASRAPKGDSGGSSSVAAIAAAVGSVVGVGLIALAIFLVRRRRLQRRAKESAGPIYQEAIEMAISPLNHATRPQREEDVSAYAVVGQKQPEPLYQAVSKSAPEVVYNYASAYVAGSHSRRVREGLTIVKHLASGNFGDVALGQLPFSVLPPRAQNLLGPAASENVQVAVKSLKSNADDKSRKDFESEAKLMAPFVHPNVVRLLAALVESEPHLVLLEFVQYGDLRTLLQKSKLHSLWWTQNEQVHAIRQIALGMEYLGTLHFVHRDLAARNCLVGQGMIVKIADFGLSREMASENDYYRMQTRGKLPVKWMAPETMTFRKFSSMSDVWAFGVTAWECCSYGAKPYGEMDGRETLAHVEAGGRLPMPETCMLELYNIMMSCWNLSPEQRPSFSQLVQSLTALQDGSTVREIGAMV